MEKIESRTPRPDDLHGYGTESARWKNIWLTVLGASLAAFALEMFLTPNRIIIGGMKGISGLLAHMTEMQMGIFLMLLNLPFILYSCRKRKNSSFVKAAWGLMLLSGLTMLLHPYPPLIENPLPAAVCGGVILGCGVGLIIRYGGLTDGMQHIAGYLAKLRVSLTIAEIVTLLNIVIFGLAGWAFGWDQAMYSAIAYYAAFKSTEYTLNRFRYRVIRIHSVRAAAIEKTLAATFANASKWMQMHAYAVDELFVIVPRQYEKDILSIVISIDQEAGVTSTSIMQSHESFS
ncbi:hypothetical protein PAESOLCIP111_00749 [Paenibacillus solanacearum]|uniref:YitT family protein n=1 Tax=Paenibacillus solanacearum TaxID=2048548 RepID=A0A916JUZ2_9BACL|nr:YitT family protein [Paenibacillus solanacearum]CAG7604900.1 hypothetical protein PAESOLCIP111_00749 [Paenibacillus solanacearum]